jgi:hypothetical protein
MRTINYVIVCIACCLCGIDVHAQLLPVENDSLNYRIVGFQVPPLTKAKEYTVEIAIGNFNKERLFNKQICIVVTDSINQLVAKVPTWGASYTWRVKNYDEKGHEINTTPLHHFRTRISRYSDTSLYKTRVITKSEKYKDIFILQDFAPVMYDADGELVWFIPDIPGVIGEGRGLRNLQPTHTGTFTLQNDFGAFEFDYHGKILWRAPDKGTISGDTSEHYHHDFKKLSNGHYLITGIQHIELPVPKNADTTNFKADNTIVKRNGFFYKIIPCPTLIEFESSGNIVWSWKSSEHIEYDDFFSRKLASGTYYSNPHLNSFFFDEKRKLIYLSYRNYNRVVKLEYPSGKVLANYGPPAYQTNGEMLFRSQHNVAVTDNSLIYMFDNNTDREKDVVSYVRIFKENQKADSLEIIWSFPCDIDTFADKCGVAGGSVLMMSDNDVLVSMGTAGRSFIVSKDKKILWNSIIYRREGSGVWIRQVQYRTKYINKINELKKFIFIN